MLQPGFGGVLQAGFDGRESEFSLGMIDAYPITLFSPRSEETEMKRSFLTIVMLCSALALGACENDDDFEDQVEDAGEEIEDAAEELDG